MNEAPWGGGIVSSCGPVGDLTIEVGIAKTALEARMSAFGTRLCKVMGYEDLPSSERLRLMSEGERVESHSQNSENDQANDNGPNLVFHVCSQISENDQADVLAFLHTQLRR